MKLDAFMKIKLDPPEASAFASSGDKDNADKVEIMSFRQTVVRATDFKGAAKEDAPSRLSSRFIGWLMRIVLDSLNALTMTSKSSSPFLSE